MDGAIQPTGPADQTAGDTSGQGGIDAALHTKVRTMGDLKDLLISSLGEEDGTKMFNTVMQSMGMMMLTQVQQSAKQADDAAKKMLQDQQQ